MAFATFDAGSSSGEAVRWAGLRISTAGTLLDIRTNRRHRIQIRDILVIDHDTVRILERTDQRDMVRGIPLRDELVTDGLVDALQGKTERRGEYFFEHGHADDGRRGW